MKNLIKVICFVIIFCILWDLIFSIIWIQDNSIKEFYKEPKDSLDVLYFGSSNAYAHFNTVLAYDTHGFTTGMLSSDSQPFSAIKYLIKEGRKYQNPNVYVIDITYITVDLKYPSEGDIRKVTDSMRFTQNRIDAINEMTDQIGVSKKDRTKYYFSFLTYHNSWQYLGKYSFFNENLYKGHILSDTTVEVKPQPNFKWMSYSDEPLKDENAKILQDLIDYVEQENLEVLFLIPPKTYTKTQISMLNNATKIIEDNNYKVINGCNENIDIDYSNDFYNPGHLNVYGATKFTLWMSEYLEDNYKLNNHKNDNKYKSWDKEYKKYKESFNKLTNLNFDTLLEKLDNN